jgi:hypothetical protein
MQSASNLVLHPLIPLIQVVVKLTGETLALHDASRDTSMSKPFRVIVLDHIVRVDEDVSNAYYDMDGRIPAHS